MHKSLMAVTAFLMLAGAAAAEATPALDRGPTLSPFAAKVVVWGRGDTIYEAGPLPEDWLKANPEIAKRLEGYKAGWKCKFFSIFWAVITKSDCTPVAYSGTMYMNESSIADPKQNWIASLNKAIGAKYKEGDMKMGFWAKFGKFVLGGVLVLLIVGGIIGKVRSKG